MVESIIVGIVAFIFGYFWGYEQRDSTISYDVAVWDMRSLKDNYPEVFKEVEARIGRVWEEIEQEFGSKYLKDIENGLRARILNR